MREGRLVIGLHFFAPLISHLSPPKCGFHMEEGYHER